MPEFSSFWNWLGWFLILLVCGAYFCNIICAICGWKESDLHRLKGKDGSE